MTIIFSHLEKPERITNAHAATYLGRNIFDERDVVEIKLVIKIVAAGRENVCHVLSRNDIRTGDVGGAVSGGGCFVCKDAILTPHSLEFGPKAKSAAMNV